MTIATKEAVKLTLTASFLRMIKPSNEVVSWRAMKAPATACTPEHHRREKIAKTFELARSTARNVRLGPTALAFGLVSG